MVRYLRRNLTRSGWQASKNLKDNAQLVWSNSDRPTDYTDVKAGQFFNHIKGSHRLTSKDNLHEELHAFRQQFYPTSFLIPKEYALFMAENNNLAVKTMLKGVVKEILVHFHKDKVGLADLMSYQVWLEQIFTSSILQTSTE
jgi:hypothetical protein